MTPLEAFHEHLCVHTQLDEDGKRMTKCRSCGWVEEEWDAHRVRMILEAAA